jgi:hypothetical protein
MGEALLELLFRETSGEGGGCWGLEGRRESLEGVKAQGVVVWVEGVGVAVRWEEVDPVCERGPQVLALVEAVG